jgi:large subunit ribosomal protein L21
MAYAIIKTGGKQYKVAEGDIIDVERLDVKAGTETSFAEVLFYTDGKDVKSSADALKGISVLAEVVEERKDKKVIAYKFRRRKGYHRTVGHRRKLTRLKIKSIKL